MRNLALVLSVALAGCASSGPYTKIRLPDTAEAKNCWRECESVFNSCPQGRYSEHLDRCHDQRYECQRSCPGAYEVTMNGYAH